MKDQLCLQSFESALGNLSQHLDALSGKIFTIEEVLGTDLFSNSSDQTTVPITTLQSLDFVRQSLEDCALLTHFISSAIAKEDFVQNGNELDFINQYRTEKIPNNYKLTYFPYNWNLNKQ